MHKVHLQTANVRLANIEYWAALAQPFSFVVNLMELESAVSVFVNFINDDTGATAIEYGLIAALVALTGVLAFTALGETITSSFADISKDFCEAAGGDFDLTDDGTGSCAFS